MFLLRSVWSCSLYKQSLKTLIVLAYTQCILQSLQRFDHLCRPEPLRSILVKEPVNSCVYSDSVIEDLSLYIITHCTNRTDHPDGLVRLFPISLYDFFSSSILPFLEQLH